MRASHRRIGAGFRAGWRSVTAPEMLALLRLQQEWGADEALLDAPVDRFGVAEARTPPAPPTVPPDVSAGLPPGVTAPPGAGAPPQVASRLPGRAPAALPGPALATAAASAADSVAALHAAMDGFTACALRATASTTVAPSGLAEPGLLMIYETPGPEDDRAGQAFSGTAGARLDRILASAGLDRTMLVLAPLVPWRPPGGRPVSAAELATCLPFLHRLLALTQPRRLVLLGNGPYRALGGTEPFRKVRGRWVTIAAAGLEAGVPALVTAAPELWLSTAASREAAWTDLVTLALALAAG